MPKYTAILALLVLMSIVAAGLPGIIPTGKSREQEQYPAGGEITIADNNLGDRGDKVREILGRRLYQSPLHADGSWFGEPTTR